MESLQPLINLLIVLTVLSMPESVDRLVSMTDALMYDVKSKGKNAIEYSVFD